MSGTYFQKGFNLKAAAIARMCARDNVRAAMVDVCRMTDALVR